MPALLATLAILKTPRMGRFSLGNFMPYGMGLLLGLGWLMPAHLLPWVSWHAEAFAFFTVLLGAWFVVAGAVRDRKLDGIAVPVASWPFLALAACAIFQTATGRVTFWGDAVVVVLYVTLCVIGLTLGYSTATRAHDAAGASMGRWSPVALLALLLMLGGFVSTLIAFAQVCDLWETSAWIARMPDPRRPGGNMGQPNHLATLLVMAMASVVYLQGARRLGSMAAGLLWLVLSAGLAVTESRAGLLGLGVLLFWWFCKRPAVSPQTSPWWGVAAGGVAVLMFVAWPTVFSAVHLMGEAAVQGRLVEGSLRLTVWPQLIEAVMLRPWWGWGIREVAEAHNAVAHAYPVSEPFTYSHNLVLDLALWVGIPATLALLGLTAVWLWRRLRAANDAVTWYALAVALPFGVHSMFEFPYAYAYFLVPVMLALGVLEGALGTRPLFRLGFKPAAGLLLVSTVLMLWSAVEYLRIEEDFRVARFEALRIGQTPAGHERPRVLLLTQLGALVDSTRIKPVPGMPAAQLALLKKVALHYPWSATQYRYALALALNGNPAEAARQMQVLRAMHGERMYGAVRRQLEQLLAEHHVVRDSLRLP